MDFYERLSEMENEAMRRARKINEAERKAADEFNLSLSDPPQRNPPPPKQHHEHKRKEGLLNSHLFSSPDMSIILVLFFILKSENCDMLLMLALIYILM